MARNDFERQTKIRVKQFTRNDVKGNDGYGIYPVEFPGILYYEKKSKAPGSIGQGETVDPARSSEWSDQLQNGSMLLPVQAVPPFEAG